MYKCSEKIFEPLKKVGKDSLFIASSDRVLHHSHPLYTTHSEDYLKHIAVIGYKIGKCLECEILSKQLEDFHS